MHSTRIMAEWSKKQERYYRPSRLIDETSRRFEIERALSKLHYLCPPLPHYMYVDLIYIYAMDSTPFRLLFSLPLVDDFITIPHSMLYYMNDSSFSSSSSSSYYYHHHHHHHNHNHHYRCLQYYMCTTTHRYFKVCV